MFTTSQTILAVVLGYLAGSGVTLFLWYRSDIKQLEKSIYGSTKKNN